MLTAPPPSTTREATAAATVLAPGPLTTVQDLGRTGYAYLGVSPSGAADQPALALANRLLGNPPGTPALECTFGGLRLRLHTGRWMALTGAPAPARINGHPIPEPRCFRLAAEDLLELGAPAYGLRTYLAIAGGVLVEPVLGGAGHDLLAGHGPPPLRPGDSLLLGQPQPLPTARAELAGTAVPGTTANVEFHWGPRDDSFDADDRQRFVTTAWRVCPETNRVGARLAGAPLHADGIHLASEGMVSGAIQIPPSGQPIVFLADHPVTGGYPVIGVVTERDLPLLAQAPPGTQVHFRPFPRKPAPERYRSIRT